MENLVVCANKKITLEKFDTQMKLVSQNNIEKIINLTAKSVIISSDISNGMVSLSGKIKLNLLYLTSENVVESAVVEQEFIEKQKFDDQLFDVFVVDDAKVKDISFSSNELICYIDHNAVIYGNFKYELPNFEQDETIVSDTKEFSGLKFFCASQDTFNVAEEDETNLTGINILKTNYYCEVDNVLCSVDKIVIEGRILTEFLFDCNGVLSSNKATIDFKQEVKAEGVVPNMKARAFAVIKSGDVKLEQKNDKNILSYVFDLIVKAYSFEESNFIVAKDVFSLENEIKTTYDFIESKNYIENLTGEQVVGSETDITRIEDFDDIIGVYEPNVTVLNETRENDKFWAELEINSYALYKTVNGIEKLPINTMCKIELDEDSDKMIEDFRAIATLSSFRVKAGKEIETAFKVEYSYNKTMIYSTKFVKSIEVCGNKLCEESGGIKVYIPKQNERLFDVAKALNVKPDLIASQNDINGEFESGQKIYVYSPINIS